jgi:predicted SnoaL-like aldol condensation-catalyzing enzyme
MSRPAEVLDAYFDGVNAEHYAEVAALWDDEGILEAPGIPILRGPAVQGYFEAALAPYREHHDKAVRTIVAGLTATVEIHVTAVTAGGSRLEFDAVDIFDFDDEGRILKMSSWYDSFAVRKQLEEALEADKAREAEQQGG